MVKKPTDFKDPVEIDLVDTFSELSTSEEAKKGDLAVIEESPALPPESNWKKAGRAVGKVARAAARRNPLGLLIDTLIQTWPTDEEVEKNFEKVQKENENILDDIATLVKGMKGEPMTRREVLRGGKAAAQVLGTPKPDILSKKDPWKTAGGGGYLHEGLPLAEYSKAADKLFDLWKKHNHKVFRNIYRTNKSYDPKKDIKHNQDYFELLLNKDMEEQFREGIQSTIDSDEVIDASGPGQEMMPRFIPDYESEWDNSRETWVWDYMDPPTTEDIKADGPGTYSDYEYIIEGIYENWDFDDPSQPVTPYSSAADMVKRESDIGHDKGVAFEKFIKDLKDKGVKRDEIYDMWKEGAERYLKNDK